MCGVVFALFGAEDNLLFATSTEPYNIGLPAGQTMEIRSSVDSRIVDAWAEEGVEPARIVTIAYVEREL